MSGLDAMVEETRGLQPPKPELLEDCPGAEVREVLVYPRDEERLRTPAMLVESFGSVLRDVVGSLAMTMYAADATSLAAPQLGWSVRVFVADILNGQPCQRGRPLSQLLVAINPTVWELPSRPVRAVEQCLSFPGAEAAVERPLQVVMKAYDLCGEPYALGCSHHLARVIQHEYDHLQGTLMLDRLDVGAGRKLQRAMWDRPLSTEKDR